MSESDFLPGGMQENIITLLCLDDNQCSILSALVKPDHFDSVFYREIAVRAIRYYDDFQKAPGIHLDDILEDLLEHKDSRKADPYRRIVENIYRISEDINRDLVLREVNDFIKLQSLKAGVMEAAKALKKNDVTNAEIILDKALTLRNEGFEKGLTLEDPDLALAFLEEETDWFRTGIDVLDKYGIAPNRQELFMMMAPPNKGKSWAMIHLGKHALLQNLRVLHITLEMSEKRVMQRYMMNLFGVGKRQENYRILTLDKDEDGIFSRLRNDTVRNRPSFLDSDIKQVLRKKMEMMRWKRQNLVIKSFPTGSLTIKELTAYLNFLERTYKFIPDEVIIDYADLMRLDDSNLRVSLSSMYKKLRGIAVERDLAMITPTQSNRSGEDARTLGLKHLSEDWSKAAIADNLVTYNQTEEEERLGLARLYVAKGRNDKKGQQILMTQNYGLGQFCLEDYWIQKRDLDLYAHNIEKLDE